ALAVLVLLVVALAGCAATPQPHGPAVVRGLADGCQDPLAKSIQPTTVLAVRPGMLVQKVDARFIDFRSRYRLVLQPGTYLISDPLSGAPTRTVTLRPGSVVTINFPNDC